MDSPHWYDRWRTATPPHWDKPPIESCMCGCKIVEAVVCCGGCEHEYRVKARQNEYGDWIPVGMQCPKCEYDDGTFTVECAECGDHPRTGWQEPEREYDDE